MPSDTMSTRLLGTSNNRAASANARSCAEVRPLPPSFTEPVIHASPASPSARRHPRTEANSASSCSTSISSNRSRRSGATLADGAPWGVRR